ncbi:MAG TPA: DUF3141 domain-containing protein [Geminicoccus sp.]|jgi:pimeloyl-ACP methyl ester carboxylesterase|uniref:DUF3141 domain-containing protein n=1 Tax=Geminicoccus sp. TaxID=2024832 RepID=UPI002E351F17|nr:DUF3141 domain-containing protein [Geminicoccus sp.]HEX2525166.1 DUF3141 domain-containing protein [Geminicoccus sp.]
MSEQAAATRQGQPRDPWADLVDYWIDRCERGVLFADVLRQRGNQYHEHMAEQVPHVLSFEAALVADGRKLERPVNYGLVRIEPPQGTVIDPKKRPFVVADPRAGHGPGIGGFKADSEIGVALRAGHPCYFIGFLPNPMPGQTVEDVMKAEASFLEKVIELHPEADGKPAVVGNCQAGWQIMMTAAIRPDLFGPIIIAGAPLSYWAGRRGQNPMRYTGGMLGGSWLTALAGDLGHGIFDGAWLVQNFESLNPANTWWGKSYNLYAKIDTEAQRYLGFEKWWGGHVLLNAQEMQYIADKLFVGNRLATAELVTSDNDRIDLRKIRSPIIVFCSKGDNITPPPQALGWITDLYRDVNDIRAHGQTIVYCVHESIGHLGIFVSGSVAKKEHDEFASNIDFIDVLPPGLYEAVLTPRSEAGSDEAGLIAGDYLVRFVARSIDDVKSIVAPDPEDERRFAAVDRISQINLGLYRTFMQPWVQAMVSAPAADWMRQMHPQRLKYELFSDNNPWLALLEDTAEQIRQNRHPAAPGNPFIQAECKVSENIESALNAAGKLRDRLVEESFLAIYGSPFLQSLVGLGDKDTPPRQRPGEDPEDRAFVQARIADLRGRIAQGGPREAWVRALIFIRLPGAAADERAFNLLRRIREERGGNMTVSQFKALVRDQFLMLLIAQDEAIAALPTLLAGVPAEQRDEALAELRRTILATGLLDEEGQRRLARVESIFGKTIPRSAVQAANASSAGPAEATPLRPRARRRAS